MESSSQQTRGGRRPLKAIFGAFLYAVSVSFLFTGCFPGAYKFKTSQSDRVCEVVVHERRAGGNCVTKDKGLISFDLWSTVTAHPIALAQGLSSEEEDVTVTRGLLINGVEKGPSDEHWNRLLRDPKSLCIEACGKADWLIAE